MMNGIREYVLTVTTGAILCSVIQHIIGKNTSVASLLRILCGVFIACLLIRPLVKIDFSSVLLSFDTYTYDANAAASTGEAFAKEAMQSVIKTETETYILDKAKSMDAELSVRVTLDDAIPVKVELIGAVSPYTRSVLSAWITQQIGIPKEAQLWTFQ